MGGWPGSPASKETRGRSSRWCWPTPCRAFTAARGTAATAITRAGECCACRLRRCAGASYTICARGRSHSRGARSGGCGGDWGGRLAIVAAQRGYRCIFVMSDKMAAEKVRLLEAYGAEVIVCPTAVAPEDPDSYYSTAERLTRETPGAFRPDQYSNPANPYAHYTTTGPEIWRDTDGTVTHFVAGAGTGGTICGVAKYLKEQNPAVKIIAADPEGSVYSGGEGRPYLTVAAVDGLLLL